MPLLSSIARRKKMQYFLETVPRSAAILEIGCGDGWVAEYFRKNGYSNYTGLDIHPPADVVGDIKNWRNLGLSAGSFDIIVAFEVIEHTDCLKDCWDLLRPGGRLLLTTPVPQADWLLKILEAIGLSQKRGTPHTHLTRLKNISVFRQKNIITVGLLSQWGVLTK